MATGSEGRLVRWLAGGAALGGAVAGAYVLGARHGRRSGKQGAEPELEPERAARDGLRPDVRPAQALVNAVPRVPAEDLLRFVAQLPDKPLSPGAAQDAHSTAKIVLVGASGKGGVGKSTVSVNLAFMLASMGLEVGLLDLDVYGPSLPELIRLPPVSVMQNQAGRIVPLDYGGVALMSWGYIQPGEAAAIRAPILTQIVGQLLTQVEWGKLDVLVVDSPPGTGDILLSLSQTLPADGAVLVTTCNSISFADVEKGLQLFTKVEIPPLLVVANMATFPCEACGHEHTLFADAALNKLPRLLQDRGVGLVCLPLDPTLAQAPDQPIPAQALRYPFVRDPDNRPRAAWQALELLARLVLESVLIGSTSHRDTVPTALKIRTGGTLEVRLRGGELRPLGAAELRAACRCAECVDEFTGEVKIDRDRIRADRNLRVTGVDARGNYAVAVTFSDRHSSLVALRALENMVGRGKSSGPADRAAGVW